MFSNFYLAKKITKMVKINNHLSYKKFKHIFKILRILFIFEVCLTKLKKILIKMSYLFMVTTKLYTR
jgi:hypothetical protein